MKKTYLILVILFLSIVFVGCANVDMQYKLDTENNLEVQYNVTIDKSKGEFEKHSYSELKSAITRQWETQGFEVDVKESADALAFTGVLNKQHDSAQQAFDSLDKMLKSEYSPFVNTGFKYACSYLEDEYNLNAKISLKDLIRRRDKQVMPTDIQDILIKNANESNFSITIALPGQVVYTNADLEENKGGDITINTWHLKYGDEKEISVNAISKNKENIKTYESLKNTTNLNRLLLIVCGGAALLLVIVFLVMFVKKRAHN